MKVTVRFPASMRRWVDGQGEVELDAATVGQAVSVLCERHGQLRERLLKPSGALKPSVAIFINNLPPAAKPDAALREGDVLVIVLPVGGG